MLLMILLLIRTASSQSNAPSAAGPTTSV